MIFVIQGICQGAERDSWSLRTGELGEKDDHNAGSGLTHECHPEVSEGSGQSQELLQHWRTAPGRCGVSQGQVLPGRASSMARAQLQHSWDRTQSLLVPSGPHRRWTAKCVEDKIPVSRGNTSEQSSLLSSTFLWSLDQLGFYWKKP